jgi:hypothetical protein
MNLGCNIDLDIDLDIDWFIQDINETLSDTYTFLDKYFYPKHRLPPYPFRIALNNILNIIQSKDKKNNLKSIVIIITDGFPNSDIGFECMNKNFSKYRIPEPSVSIRYAIKEFNYLKKNSMKPNWKHYWNNICNYFRQEDIRTMTIYTGNLHDCGSNNYLWTLLGDTMFLNEIRPSIKTSIISSINCYIGLEDKISSRNTPIFNNISLDFILKNSDPSKVIEVFDQLFEMKDPCKIFILLENNVIGKFWRNVICGTYRHLHNNLYEDACINIINKFSLLKQQVSLEYQMKFDMWLVNAERESSDVIYHIMKNFLSDKRSYGYLYIPNNYIKTIELKQQVIALCREGEYKEMSDIILNISLCNDEYYLPTDEGAIINFIPIHMTDLTTIFKLIANLIYPGLMFSKTETFLIAILALKNECLKDRADVYLHQNKGAWMNWILDDKYNQKIPKFSSLNIIELLNLVHNDYLTSDEISFHNKYSNISLIPSHFRIYSTYKLLCNFCNNYRCFTSIDGESKKCVFCTIKDDLDPNLYDPSFLIEGKEEFVWWTQCRNKKCNTCYTVKFKHNLNIRPKCHYCRNNLKTSYIKCSCCKKKYINFNNSAVLVLKNNEFICRYIKVYKSI